MKILGIETSCDETAVCLIEASGEFGGQFTCGVLGNALHSQIAIHEKYGGVFPNLAKREHAKALVPLLEVALTEAGELRPRRNSPAEYQGEALLSIKELLAREPELFDALSTFVQTHDKPAIDAIAVTKGPGLEPALWVGVNFARALSILWNIPLVPVNHLEGHIVMALMDENNMRAVGFPLLALTISGGHTQLDLSNEWMQYQTIGQTRDDAAGEAYDKVARMLGLTYPGGPQIAKLAEAARISVDNPKFKFPRPMLNQHNYDFSFSGLKTEVRRRIADIANSNSRGEASWLSDGEKMDIARAFEDAVSDVLIGKTMRAAEEFGAQTVVVGGGVSANSFIRENLARELTIRGIPLFAPTPSLATDNALMIALAGYFRALKKEFADAMELRADGNLKL